MTQFNGDDILSPFLRRLWSLTYSCLYKFECPVIFKTFGPDVPRRMNQHIYFFVPAHHPACQDVMDYLREELKDEVRPEKEVHGEFWFGTNVSILEYSGTDLYLERAECRKMAENFLKTFMEKIETIKGAS